MPGSFALLASPIPGLHWTRTCPLPPTPLPLPRRPPTACQAEQLIKRRLEVTPDEPRLWCALGDLTLDDAAYLQAWERSGHRNARWVVAWGGIAPVQPRRSASAFPLSAAACHLLMRGCKLEPGL